MKWQDTTRVTGGDYRKEPSLMRILFQTTLAVIYRKMYDDGLTVDKIYSISTAYNQKEKYTTMHIECDLIESDSPREDFEEKFNGLISLIVAVPE